MAAVEQQAVFVPPAGGKVVSHAGLESVFKLGPEPTGGVFSLVEFAVQPGGFVPPHVHERTDEVSYVLDGELGFMVDDDDLVARAGATVFRPKGVPHALWNPTDRRARLVEVYTPGGFERWFEVLARLFGGDGPPTLRELDEAGRRHDTFLVPELVPRLVETHALQLPPLRES